MAMRRGDEHGIGIKNLTMNEAQLAPFPENPGVVVIEGIPQTAAVLALRLMPPTERPRITFFMAIDKAKFRTPVRPGDTLEYHVDKVAQRRKYVAVPRRGEDRRHPGRRGGAWRLLGRWLTDRGVLIVPAGSTRRLTGVASGMTVSVRRAQRT
jgi:FabA-like domain